jgi:hypothetical protein
LRRALPWGEDETVVEADISEASGHVDVVVRETPTTTC